MVGDSATEGSTVEFDRVLLVDADGTVKVGAPTVEGELAAKNLNSKSFAF